MDDERELPVELPAEIVEVPLAGDESPSSGPIGAPRPPADRRRVTGLSALAGVVIGIVVAVVVVSAGGDDEPPSTTLDPDELSSAITVPPTLAPVTEPTLPPVPGERAPADVGDADGGPVTDLAVVAASVATLPSRVELDLQPPDGFRLSDGSVAALEAPLPRRSVTEYVVGVDGFEQVVTISNDPETGRYLLEFDFGGEVQSVIVDLVGGTTYLEELPGEWATIANEEVAANTGAPDLATFLRNLQLGPIRSDTRPAWELIRANGLVETPDGEDLREWIVVLDAAAVPEWARYAFGPGSEAAPLPDNTWVGYAVYVARDGGIRRVTGSAEFGVTSQRIVHRIDVLDDPPAIDLPLVEPTVPPVTPPPATTPPTTPATSPTTPPTTGP